jgi:hypothetical protein
MAHVTEAAGLLRTGNLFLRRVGLRRRGQDEVRALAGLKPGPSDERPGAFAVYLGDEPFFHFDLEGRWQRIYEAGTHYRKALDASVDALDRRREGKSLVMRRRSLPFAEIADLDAKARAMALDLLADLGSGRDELLPPPDGSRALPLEELRELLERVARWDAEAWFRHREAYVATYAPLPLLPPDAPLAVTFQATLGHARGRAFGHAPAFDYAERTPEEFAQHARQVLALLGRRIEQAKGAFLAGPDVLRLPYDWLAAHLETIRGLDARGRLERVVAWLDDPTPPLYEPGDWSRLRALGLERVAVAIESGDPEVRGLYGSLWTNEDLRGAVGLLQGAGIGVSLIVLADAGGTAFADRHGRETASLVATLGLRPGDAVFVLDAAEAGDASVGGAVEPCGPADTEVRRGALLAALRAAKPAGVKVVPYSPEKQ